MPFPWICMPADLRQGSRPTPVRVDDQLTVTSDRQTLDLPGRASVFDGNVVATYGVERVFADHLEIHSALDQRWASASGNVKLVDPDGTVKASSLKFSWNSEHRFAVGADVDVQVAGATIRARTANVTPSLWTFTDYYVTTDRNKPALYSVSGSVLSVTPGQSVVFQKPALSILGHHILTLKKETYSLDPRATGLRAPTIQYRRGVGLGVTWSSGFLLGANTSIEWRADAFRNERPGYGIQLTRSYIKPERSERLLAPQSELDERFAFGYFESVEVLSPDQEPQFMKQPRRAISLSSSFNSGVSDRGADGELFSQPVQLAYEVGGPFGNWSALTDIRLESIQRQSDPLRNRAVAQTSVEAPRLTLKPNLFTLARLDGSLFFSGSGFGWARGTAGLVFKPSHMFTLGGAVVGAVEGGRPDFDIDPLYWKNGFVLRADADFGSRRLSTLVRYDTRLRFFDAEYSFSQAVGSLEFYVLYRRYPGDYRYGIRLRMDQFVNLLRRRQFERPSSGQRLSGLGRR